MNANGVVHLPISDQDLTISMCLPTRLHHRFPWFGSCSQWEWGRCFSLWSSYCRCRLSSPRYTRWIRRRTWLRLSRRLIRTSLRTQIRWMSWPLAHHDHWSRQMNLGLWVRPECSNSSLSCAGEGPRRDESRQPRLCSGRSHECWSNCQHWSAQQVWKLLLLFQQ